MRAYDVCMSEKKYGSMLHTGDESDHIVQPR